MRRRCQFCLRRRWFWKVEPGALGRCKDVSNCAHYMAVGMGDAEAKTREERWRFG
jgi:hypothetical protein